MIRKWSLADVALIADTRTSHVFRARQNGQSVIIKSFKTSGLQEFDGLAYLKWRDGRGAVKILDIHGGNCLMEDAGKVTLRQLHQDMGEPAANKVLAMTLPDLFARPSGPYPQDLPNMHTHFSALLEFEPENHPSHFARSMRFAAETALNLLRNQHDIRPLHGDIHHDNIATSDGTRWLAIDPQGLIGDPHYDVANLFGNPDGNPQLLTDPQRASNLADMLAAVLNLDRRRILEFALAHCGVSIAWSLKDDDISEHKNAEERLRLIPMLRSLLSNDQSKTDP